MRMQTPEGIAREHNGRLARIGLVPSVLLPKPKKERKTKPRRGKHPHHGLDREQRLAMLAAHTGECEICGDRARLCVDHCHHTGKIRGLLCNGCNGMLGFANDDTARLNKGIDYLNKHLTVNNLESGVGWEDVDYFLTP